MEADFYVTKDEKGHAVKKHAGGYLPITRSDHADALIDKRHIGRLEELWIKASLYLRRMGVHGDIEVTQIGKRGFHWKWPEEPIPSFEEWPLTTHIENVRIFGW